MLVVALHLRFVLAAGLRAVLALLLGADLLAGLAVRDVDAFVAGFLAIAISDFPFV